MRGFVKLSSRKLEGGGSFLFLGGLEGCGGSIRDPGFEPIGMGQIEKNLYTSATLASLVPRILLDISDFMPCHTPRT